MEKVNLIEDRDFFTREFRKSLITESTGGYIHDLLNDLFYAVDELPEKSAKISEKDTYKIKEEIEKLTKIMKSTLHGKGLIGW